MQAISLLMAPVAPEPLNTTASDGPAFSAPRTFSCASRYSVVIKEPV